ncbi:Sugar transporter ERD6-like 7 [Artemisia annua]|uniref:Sugar transporter ERD6-like 7 n=1 Tax=Artemisia annua TaxID=35608 RepID=A0A2U1NHH3_ARTAN|nr:Sugar transporter ERD6-like 7 [Artemisia annua]
MDSNLLCRAYDHCSTVACLCYRNLHHMEDLGINRYRHLKHTLLDWSQFPSIVLVIGLFFIPVSPRWLAKTGNDKEFSVALRKLRGKDADISALNLTDNKYLLIRLDF